MSIITLSKTSTVEVEESVTTTRSLETRSKPESSGQLSSNFSDGACGEPFRTQHLLINFTPVEELDDDYTQKKCCAFWEFLGSRPELRNLMVLPEKNEMLETTTSMDYSTSESGNDDKELQRTAVSVLSFVEDNGLIDRTFETKLQRSMCSLGSREYVFNGTVGPEPLIPARDETVCSCSGVCNSCPKKKPSNRSQLSSSRSTEVRGISKEMKEWDAKHPKSMDPPEHPPSVSSNSIQRMAT